jgi:hypothetical protein
MHLLTNNAEKKTANLLNFSLWIYMDKRNMLENNSKLIKTDFAKTG